ncbi:MAG: hypothetical protein J6P19_06125 [Acetobacter sp.]|nr:hypothetical protein [Acetobacter sp.]
MLKKSYKAIKQRGLFILIEFLFILNNGGEHRLLKGALKGALMRGDKS